ncbi:glycoprotease [Campylobacter sp. VBCF_05 NA6]|uniref:glycoprotease n=1 Tax=unclassified Campylobacter TaxID=2593542 RepID=UPI0022E9BABD|nr:MULTISPECIES: glycoprotease [unclassified Campylobacter]MDA3058074.1 glycoprotease [Campylobacter sp. VBCF_04 NA7]MDA3059371.1 glycoprotease [Campylobacter sp. VBCF_05 NA6]
MLVGIYEKNDKILEFFSAPGQKADEFLVEKFSQILKEYKISELIYANTPGSFMGIKVSFVMLKTLSIALNLPLYAVSGFELNGFLPIRANKAFSYIYENGEIKMAKLEPAPMKLPQNLSTLNKSNDILPNYIIDAV